jgi:hypothetical protein
MQFTVEFRNGFRQSARTGLEIVDLARQQLGVPELSATLVADVPGWCVYPEVVITEKMARAAGSAFRQCTSVSVWANRNTGAGDLRQFVALQAKAQRNADTDAIESVTWQRTIDIDGLISAWIDAGAPFGCIETSEWIVKERSNDN